MNPRHRNILIWLMVILGFSIFTGNSPASVSSQSRQLSNSDRLVLEYSVFVRGIHSSWCNDTIRTRLFADGRLQLEGCDVKLPEKANKTIRRDEYSITKKEYKLNIEEVEELVKLAEQPDFLSGTVRYGKIASDFLVEVTITYHGRDGVKKIIAWNVYPAIDDSELPVSVNKLFLRLGEILKAKAKL